MKATRQQLLNLAMGKEVTFEMADPCMIVDCEELQDCLECPLFQTDFLKQEIEIPKSWVE